MQDLVSFKCLIAECGQGLSRDPGVPSRCRAVEFDPCTAD